MGIYDRDYYRNDASSFTRWVNPHRACIWLIAINVFVFVMQMTTRHGGASQLLQHFSLQPDRVMHGEVWRLLTAAFLHSEVDIWHVVMNMFVLWFFGTEVEEIYGAKEFLATYLMAAIFSSLAFVGYEYAAHPQHLSSAVGASGAVTAVMVIYALHFPTRTILFMMILPVPAIVLVSLYVIIDIMRAFGDRAGQQIAFAAHLGGAFFGFLYYRFHWRVMNWWPSRMSMKPRRFTRPRLRVYRGPAESDTAIATERSDDSQKLEAQLDSVLEKVATYGKASLTAREQEILMKASEVYKQRRK